jgi:hypothetical protein
MGESIRNGRIEPQLPFFALATTKQQRGKKR